MNILEFKKTVLLWNYEYFFIYRLKNQKKIFFIIIQTFDIVFQRKWFIVHFRFKTVLSCIHHGGLKMDGLYK